MNVPPGIMRQLDEKKRYRGEEPFQPPAELATAGVKVFLSAPSIVTPQQRGLIELIVEAVEQEGLRVARLTRDGYAASGPLTDVRQAMTECGGVVILGLARALGRDRSLARGHER